MKQRFDPLANQPQRTIHDVACAVCGCVCDDLTLRIDGGRVREMHPPCALAESWMVGLSANEDAPVARIGQRVVSFEQAVDRAAELLSKARAPLVYGLSRSSTAGQRAACRLADHLGATIDTTASTCHAPSIVALQAAGESTCSLGEIKNRSDLIVYWGSNPVESHPRHLERFVEGRSPAFPQGRQNRHLVVVDPVETETAKLADTFVQLQPGADFDLIWTLRALLRGTPIAQEALGGLEPAAIRKFVELLASSHYGAVFFGLGLTRRGAPHANVEALLRLVTDLNRHTRFVARRMRVPGDVAGADSVLCWQTGFPFSVNLARGFPRYSPGEYTAQVLLERAEVDAAVLVGGEGVAKLSASARAQLAQIPNIVLDYPGVAWDFAAEVRFTTAIYGVHQPGSAYRMDEVPIPLRAFFHSPLPPDEVVLKAITAKLPRRCW